MIKVVVNQRLGKLVLRPVFEPDDEMLAESHNLSLNDSTIWTIVTSWMEPYLIKLCILKEWGDLI